MSALDRVQQQRAIVARSPDLPALAALAVGHGPSTGVVAAFVKADSAGAALQARRSRVAGGGIPLHERSHSPRHGAEVAAPRDQAEYPAERKERSVHQAQPSRGASRMSRRAA